MSQDGFQPGHRFASGGIVVKSSKTIKLPGMKYQAIVLGVLPGSPEPYATWIGLPLEDLAASGNYFARLNDAHKDFGRRAAALYDRALVECSLSLEQWDDYGDLTPA